MNIKKIFLTFAVLCGIGLMIGCNHRSTNEPVTDIVIEKINQYDTEGRKDGLWKYEEYGWEKTENYVNGVLNGHATYSLSENNQNMIIEEIDYCNGIECGEIKMFVKGLLQYHVTNITNVDTMINGNLLKYRAHYTEYNDSSIVIREGNGYYLDLDGLFIDGFLGFGEWIVYDTLNNTYKKIFLSEITDSDCIGETLK